LDQIIIHAFVCALPDGP